MFIAHRQAIVGDRDNESSHLPPPEYCSLLLLERQVISQNQMQTVTDLSRTLLWVRPCIICLLCLFQPKKKMKMTPYAHSQSTEACVEHIRQNGQWMRPLVNVCAFSTADAVATETVSIPVETVNQPVNSGRKCEAEVLGGTYSIAIMSVRLYLNFDFWHVGWFMLWLIQS